MTVTIRLSDLKWRDACSDQQLLFRDTFGKSVTFNSLEEFETACTSHDFDYWWAGRRLLPKRARAEFRSQDGRLLNDYLDRAEAFRHKVRAEGGTFERYERKRSQLKRRYERQLPLLFARLYWASKRSLFSRIFFPADV